MLCTPSHTAVVVVVNVVEVSSKKLGKISLFVTWKIILKETTDDAAWKNQVKSKAGIFLLWFMFPVVVEFAPNDDFTTYRTISLEAQIVGKVTFFCYLLHKDVNWLSGPPPDLIYYHKKTTWFSVRLVAAAASNDDNMMMMMMMMARGHFLRHHRHRRTEPPMPPGGSTLVRTRRQNWVFFCSIQGVTLSTQPQFLIMSRGG